MVKNRARRINDLKTEIARTDRIIDGIKAQLEMAKQMRSELAKELKFKEQTEATFHSQPIDAEYVEPKRKGKR